MFPGCYKIPIGISASGPNSRCHQQNKIRLNDVSLNCVIICHALIQCLRCMIFIGATQHIYESLTSHHPSYMTTPMWSWWWSYKRGSTVLSQHHRIRDKMLHACAPWGATCTAKQGRIVQMQNFIFGQFSNFFFIQMGPGPNHPLPNYFWIFGIFFNFAKPLRPLWELKI